MITIYIVSTIYHYTKFYLEGQSLYNYTMQRVLKISIDQIPETARKIASRLRGGEILALVGPLGSGKTTFTQALGKALGIRKKITSPTFILMQQYPARVTNKDGRKRRVTLYHLDLYRTENFREVAALGISEHWGAPETVTVIEWAEKIQSKIPKNSIFIHITNPYA